MEEIKKVVNSNLEKSIEFLENLIRFKSISGEGEKEIQEFIFNIFGDFGKVSLVEIPDSLKNDPEYTFAERELDYSSRKNLVLEYPSQGSGKSIILNTHSDVVPADSPDAFNPVLKDGYIYGRGACDAKGQIATIYLVLLALKQLKVNLKGKLTVEIVIEEEVGGNGTLSLIRDGYKADGVIVLEPTSLKICPANRGAVWFKLDIEGKSVHMGKIREGVNAIEKMCFIMHKLKTYERKLIEESKNVPLFENFDQPVQVNFGKIYGGTWPSMVCGFVSLEGGIGFLPNKNLNQIKQEIKEIIENCGDDWIVNHYNLSFKKLHNDAYAIPVSHPIVQTIKNSAEKMGYSPQIEGFIASCDARLFNKVGNMPVIVFGPGLLEDAHSKNEKIKIDDIKITAEILTHTVISWTGGFD